MEIWLKESDKNAFRLPVLPKDYTVTSGNVVNTININDIGEIAVFTGPKLNSITLTSFFPNQVYPFCQYSNLIKPKDSVAKVEKWHKEGTIIRLVATSTNINMPMLIEHFRWGEQDGTGDIYFEIILREYKYLKTPTKVSDPPPKRPTPPPPPAKRTHTVKSGDCLWNIAVKYYGNGSRYTDIFNANRDKINNPNLIYPGQVLVIP